MIKKDSIRLEIIPELEEYIVPLRRDEYAQLERNISIEGCREALTVWKKGNKNILIDGHNRYKICNKFGILFKIKQLKFKNIDEVKLWVINNQLGRRNLNPDQMSYYRGVKYESLKKDKGGYKAYLSKGQSDILTSEKLAKEFKVSESTIKRDAKYARGLNFIEKLNPRLKMRILYGEIPFTRSKINLLDEPDIQKKIKSIINELDLENKLEAIRRDIIQEMEKQLQKKSPKKINGEGLSFKEEPLFADEEYRLKKIKGMILSNLNKAIKDKDVSSLEEIRKLINRLQDIIE